MRKFALAVTAALTALSPASAQTPGQGGDAGEAAFRSLY